MSGWWFSPAQLVCNSGLDFPLPHASTKPLTLSFVPSPENKKQMSSLKVAVLPFTLWLWAMGREEGKRANFLEGVKQG